MHFNDDILLAPYNRSRRTPLRITLAALFGCLLMMATLVAQSTAAEHEAVREKAAIVTLDRQILK